MRKPTQTYKIKLNFQKIFISCDNLQFFNSLSLPVGFYHRFLNSLNDMIFNLIVVLVSSLALTDATPNFWVYGCQPGNVSATLPFCDYNLPINERVNDLISRLDITEKLGLLGSDANTLVNNCNNMDHGVPRLGIPTYMNLVEANSAVASACVAENVCATSFPGPTNLAATFNRSLWHHKGEVIHRMQIHSQNYIKLGL